jgi:phosphate transport system substrate-binding protein
MEKRLLGMAVILLAATMAFASGSTETAGGFKGVYKLGGSTTVDPIARSAIEAFARKHPEAKLSYDSQGSGVGINGVNDGVYSLGGSSRELTQAEKDKGLVENTIALDGLAVIVSSSVPIADLSRKQVADIFNGTTTRWSQLGGPDSPIFVVVRDESSGTRVAFSDLVLLKEYKKEDPRSLVLRDAITVTSNGDMAVKVGTTPNAIGYCGEGFLEEAKSAGAKPVSIGGVHVSAATVLDKTYPISRYLYLISKGALKEGTLEKTFYDFVVSPEGQKIVKQEGFIPLKK